MSISALRKAHPGKFVFRFELAAPTTSNLVGDGASAYEGILPVESGEEMRDFERRFRKLLLSVGGPALPKRRPPKGMVLVRKAKGEEGE